MASVAFDYSPIPVHESFHRSTAYERTCFGGYGSGKSWALCAEAIAVGLEQPGSEILVCRKTIPSLRDTTEAIFTDLLPPKFLAQCDVRRMGAHNESITFPNGTKYMFRGMDDWTKHKSMSLAWIFYDEADEIDQESYEGMMSRVRQRNPTAKAKALGAGPITRRGICCASNPAGRNWIWQRFVSDKAAPGTEWFRSTSLDNPHLPMTYIDSLLAMPKPWVERYVLCGFDDFAGQVYEDWAWDTHVVQPYVDYDPDSMFIMGLDPGTRDPTAALWAYYDKAKHEVVGVAEYQEDSLAAAKHATEWRRIEARHKMRVRRRIADPQAINVRDRGTNMQLSDQYRRLGFNFVLGPSRHNDRIPMLGQLIFMRRFKVTTDCPRAYEQIKNYRWEDLTPAQRSKGIDAPERPLKKNSHLVDCAQYIASRYIAPPKVSHKSSGDEFSDQVRTAIRKQIANRGGQPNHDLGSICL